MKQAHRAIIISALAAAGLLMGSSAMAGESYMEHQVREKHVREFSLGKTTTKNNKSERNRRYKKGHRGDSQVEGNLG